MWGYKKCIPYICEVKELVKNTKKIKIGKLNFYIVEDKSYGYIRLLSEQYSYINKPENKVKILEKAERIYDIVNKKSKSRMSKFYKDLSCNFKLLEEKSLEYKK